MSNDLTSQIKIVFEWNNFCSPSNWLEYNCRTYQNALVQKYFNIVCGFFLKYCHEINWILY